jgi:glycosyltransferase involved in cell wall biosynthesis
MFDCFRNQTYPKNRIEWIIVDDGTDKIQDLVNASNIPQIRYFPLDEKMTLGAKRNYMHSHVKGSIVVYMDDDDYYPPERIEHAVETLMQNRDALCAGSSEIYIYFKHVEKMVQFGPYGPNHATAGTFAFRTELLKQTKYNDTASLAEERFFLKDYTIPFVQLDPLKTSLVFSHEHNTFDKRKLLENPNPKVTKPSDKTVDTFIRKPTEANIKDFFMDKIDGLLKSYAPGLPIMKPDVLKQIKEIDEERAKMVANHANQANNQIIMSRPGEEPTALSNEQVVALITQQQKQLEFMSQRIRELEEINQQLQLRLVTKSSNTNDPEKTVFLMNYKRESNSLPTYSGNQKKSEPEIKIVI